MRRAARELEQLRARGRRAGRAVGVGDGDDFCARSDGGEEALEGELQIVGGLHRDYARIGCRGVDLVHGVGGHGQQQLVAGFEKCFEEHVNGFVDAVGERDLLGGEAEMRGDDGFDWFALGIARECAGGDAAQDFAHFGRAGKRVLVEVEAQGIAAAERRMILLHRLHAGAGTWMSAMTLGPLRDVPLGSSARFMLTYGLRFLQAGADGFGVAGEAFGFGEQRGLGPRASEAPARSTPAR